MRPSPNAAILAPMVTPRAKLRELLCPWAVLFAVCVVFLPFVLGFSAPRSAADDSYTKANPRAIVTVAKERVQARAPLLPRLESAALSQGRSHLALQPIKKKSTPLISLEWNLSPRQSATNSGGSDSGSPVVLTIYQRKAQYSHGFPRGPPFASPERFPQPKTKQCVAGLLGGAWRPPIAVLSRPLHQRILACQNCRIHNQIQKEVPTGALLLNNNSEIPSPGEVPLLTTRRNQSG